MTKEELYADYLKVKTMHSPLHTKVVFLTNLLSNHSNPWRVTGITHEALRVFVAHDFKKVSRMGINRSHLTPRKDTYDTLLRTDFGSIEEWWDFYFSRDMTILSTSSENMSNHFSEIYDVNPTLGLFRNSGYAWKHGKDEITFIKQLASKYVNYMSE